MGYGGKVAEQLAARRLRADGMTVPDIAAELGVSKSSVSLWVRDVPVPEMVRRRTRNHTPHPHKLRRLAEIEEMDQHGIERLGQLDEQAFLAAGAALYAGEGAKRDGVVAFANTNVDIARFFLAWLREFFGVDESRLRCALYLHDGLDLEAASEYWSSHLDVPLDQFTQPQIVSRPAVIRTNRHEHGCITVRYACARTHRAVMGLVRALLTSEVLPG